MRTDKIIATVSKKQIIKDIKKAIPASEQIQNISFGNNRETVYVNITTTGTKEGFDTIIKRTINDTEIIDIAKNILNQKEIDYKNDSLRSVIENKPGDSMEPMDYGSFNFVGVSFDFADKVVS